MHFLITTDGLILAIASRLILILILIEITRETDD